MFNFLKLPASARMAALGGANISSPESDLGLALNNPGLLREEINGHLQANFNLFYAGIHGYALGYGYYQPDLKTTFAAGLHYLDYGNIMQTDAAGNPYGNFRPNDWVMQISASHRYEEKWNYGMSLKFISSNYGVYRSNGVAVDAGLVYADTARLFSASFLVKNMGTQLKKYTGAGKDELPFDLQIGLTQKLRNAPFAFSLTALKLHRFDIRYDDTVYNNENGIRNQPDHLFTAGKVLDHLVLSATINLGDRLQLMTGYNFLRRRELNAGPAGNGLNGFSAGLSANLSRFQFTYALSFYQTGTGMNQLSLELPLQNLGGLGKSGK